jgi:hypothetical protein
MSLQVSAATANRISKWLWLGAVIAAGAVDTSLADSGRYRDSPHGSATSGVLRVPDVPRGSCAQCHASHDVMLSQPFGLFRENSNKLCTSASLGGCHADRPTGGSSGYPAQEADRLPSGSSDPGYFEAHAGGIRLEGVQHRVRWPGQLVWEDPLFSPHYYSEAMPLKDVEGYGSCDNCHDAHGGGGSHDHLDTTYSGIVGSQNGALPANYALCLNCHGQFGPPVMNDTARMIAYYYDRSINEQAGHGSSAQGYVPSQARLPCYDCHNPHGSAGNGSAGGNRYLLSDQRPGWYGLTNIKYDNLQVRRFCFGCHTSSDGRGGGTVEGMTPEALPVEVPAHRHDLLPDEVADPALHCYHCHGRDYSSSTSHNVHNPGQ